MNQKEPSRQTTGNSKKVGVWLLAIALIGMIVLGGAAMFFARGAAETGAEPLAALSETEALASTAEPARSAATATESPSATPASSPTTAPSATPLPTATPLPLPVWNNPPEAALAALGEQWLIDPVLIEQTNTGTWGYLPDSFVHPIALESDGQTAYLLDAGRVMQLDLTPPAPPEVLLRSGDVVEGVRVLEPLDLSLSAEALLVLDRAGDVYRYDLASGVWSLSRYDRPAEESSGHYFVALDEAATPLLLETNYKFVTEFNSEAYPSAWRLDDLRAVDLSAAGEAVYVLQRALHTTDGQVVKYRATAEDKNFRTRFPIDQPRQIVATESAVFVLDQNGRRLLRFDPATGGLMGLWQLPVSEAISAVWVSDSAETILLAGRDRLFFVGRPDWLAAIAGGEPLIGPQPHDPDVLSALDGMRVPIGGSNITFRDFQLPGAPRHYRLGVHYGADFYWQPGTQVLAAGDGVVIRADTAYQPPNVFELNAWWSEAQALGYTSDAVLDNYLGRQVQIQHPNGLVTRYAHLSELAAGIEVGSAVVAGQVIGAVGNSGSPASLESPESDAHLHFEMWLADHYIGQYLRPIEAREWIERILGNG